MYRNYRSAYERACDCTCPAHHGQPRLPYTDPGCQCRATCASQPMTLLTPQIGGALFLNYHGSLWFVPALEPATGTGDTPPPSTSATDCSRPPT